MKKLLLVMLVPVLVLGLFSCGKLLDGEMMPYVLQGTWGETDVILTLTGNQASLYSKTDKFLPAAFRVEVSGKVEDDNSIADGTIKFVGFKDKKAAELATVKYDLNAAGTTLTLKEFKPTDAGDAKILSVLIPDAGDPDATKDYTKKE